MSSLNYSIPCTLAIALGANLPSPAGPPSSTLIKIRPILEKLIYEWIRSLPEQEAEEKQINESLLWNWSPLFETEPIGGPPNQPPFTNAVLLVEGDQMKRANPSEPAALDLLNRFLFLEKEFGRDRNNSIKWGPRSLDIDFLCWGSLHIKNDDLILPHPRLIERNFVITPLASALSKNSPNIVQIPPQVGWKE